MLCPTRGALLRYGPATAKVWATQDERWVYATISGSPEARDDLIMMLRETLRTLFAEYKNLSVVEQMEWDGDFASRNACRVILSGDTRQHHSVERGDALRVLERVGAVSQVVLTKIFRQLDPVQRAAIYDLSEGETARGFDNKTNLKWLEGRGTFAGLCPRDPRALREAMKDEHFAQAQRRRAQTEARVAIFKNEFLGRPMRSEGFENRALQVAWGVLTPF